MPRGRPKMIGPKPPGGAYKNLLTKKRLAAKAAAWDAISTAVMASGTVRRRRPRRTLPVSTAAAAPVRRTRQGRPRTIGPNLPPGGYKTLMSKKRLAAKEANFYPGPQMAYGEYF